MHDAMRHVTHYAMHEAMHHVTHHAMHHATHHAMHHAMHHVTHYAMHDAMHYSPSDQPSAYASPSSPRALAAASASRNSCSYMGGGRLET